MACALRTGRESPQRRMIALVLPTAYNRRTHTGGVSVLVANFFIFFSFFFFLLFVINTRFDYRQIGEIRPQSENYNDIAKRRRRSRRRSRRRRAKREGSIGRSSDRFAGSQPTDRRATCCWCCTEPRPPTGPSIKAARGNTT